MDNQLRMADYQSEEELIQNLRDADCSEQMISDFLEDIHAGRRTLGVRLLREHRQRLLEDIRLGQKRIDCLDYLLYALRDSRS